MANLTTSGTSNYPTSVDTSTTLVDGSGGDEIIAENVNGPTAAVVNIETELGTLPKGSAADLKTRLAVALNNDGTIKSTVIVANTPTSVSYSSGVFTLTTTPNIDQKLSGDLVQMVSVQVTGFTTTTIVIPLDDSPIQSTEGAAFGLTVNMKPTSALNSVYVRGDLHGSAGAGGVYSVGVFLAASSSAVMGVTANVGAAGTYSTPLSFTWKATTVSAATTTYALNVGPNAGTLTLNGITSSGLFGNAETSLLTVWEVQN